MAQIIKHRRGSLEGLSAVTSSVQKGELLIATGSSNLTTVNGASLVFAAAADGQIQAVNRFLQGNSAPSTFSNASYNGLVNGVPYYDSGSGTLYLLGSDANTAINLVGNIQPFSASVDSRLDSIESSIGGGGALASRVSSLETSSVNVNSFTQSVDGKFSTLATYTGSVETRLTQVGVVSGSLISSASAASVSISNINSFTQSFSQSVATDFSASAASVAALSASVASVTGDFSSSVATSFSASAASQTALSQSVSASFAVVAGQQSAQDTKISGLSNLTGSYATTGSNIFYGNQVITGSVYVAYDLIVQGSSSLQYITASAVDLGINTITLNNDSPAVRFGGISVVDSGSNAGQSGSLLWDSLNNNWIYQHPSGGAESGMTAILISGPLNSGSMGSETHITPGKIMVATGDDHIGDSIATQATDNSKITIGGGLDVTGNISGSIVGIGNVAAFSSSVDSRLDTIEGSLGSGGSIGSRVSALETSSANVNSFTSSQLTQNSNLATYTGSVDTRLTEIGVVSGSLISSASAAAIANANQNLFTQSVDGKFSTLATYTGSVDTRLTEIGVVSGSLISSASAAAIANANLNTFSASANTSISNLNTFSASVNTSVAALNTSSASQQVSIDNLNTFSASVNTSVSSLNSFSGSQLTQNTALANVTGSLISSASAAKTTNDAQDVSITNLNSATASLLTSVANLNSFSGSQLTQNTALATVTGSLISSASAASVSISNINSFTQSAASRLTTLEGTGTIQGLGTGNNVTFAKVTTSGDVVVGGDLVVQGNTVSLNTATLVVEDKLITLASGSTSSATADGAGFEVAGANANFVYQHSTTAFTSSIALIAPEVTASVNLGTAAGNSKRIAFRNTNGNLDLVPTASVSGDLLQWNGTDFVMSNTIDGGSF